VVVQHPLIEFDCSMDSLEPAVIMGLLKKNDSLQEEALKIHVSYIADECAKRFKPRGVYKLFNPTICTLPPTYTEPAIKLVGTMMVFKGKTVYDRLKRATHCALLSVTLDSETVIDTLREQLCYNDFDSHIFDACCAMMLERAADMISAEIIRVAREKTLYTDERLCPGEGDLPLNTRDQILFYTQAEKRLGIHLTSESEPVPRLSLFGVIGMYDKTQKGRRRACGRCKYRDYCSIRAVGMNCHGDKGSFK